MLRGIAVSLLWFGFSYPQFVLGLSAGKSNPINASCDLNKQKRPCKVGRNFYMGKRHLTKARSRFKSAKSLLDEKIYFHTNRF